MLRSRSLDPPETTHSQDLREIHTLSRHTATHSTVWVRNTFLEFGECGDSDLDDNFNLPHQESAPLRSQPISQPEEQTCVKQSKAFGISNRQWDCGMESQTTGSTQDPFQGDHGIESSSWSNEGSLCSDTCADDNMLKPTPSGSENYFLNESPGNEGSMLVATAKNRLNNSALEEDGGDVTSTTATGYRSLGDKEQDEPPHVASTDDTQQKMVTNFCTNCGIKASMHFRFCSHCGSQLHADNSTQAQVPPASGGNALLAHAQSQEPKDLLGDICHMAFKQSAQSDIDLLRRELASVRCNNAQRRMQEVWRR